MFINESIIFTKYFKFKTDFDFYYSRIYFNFINKTIDNFKLLSNYLMLFVFDYYFFNRYIIHFNLHLI
jgi:hypothetical protein